MAPQKLQAIKLDYHPKGGITKQEIAEIEKFAKDKSTHFAYVLENNASDNFTHHLHAIFLFDEEVAPGDLFGQTKLFGRRIKKYLEKSESIWKRAVNVSGVYNDDYYSNYMQKESKLSVSLALNKEEREAYYKDIEKKEAKKFADGYFSMLEEMWFEGHPSRPPRDIEEVSNFIACLMYRDRKIQVIQDPRCMKQKSRALYSFIMRATAYDYHSGVTLVDEDEAWGGGPRTGLSR